MDTIDIGSVPNEEKCLAVGDMRVNSGMMRREALIYKDLLERNYPNAFFVIKRNDHDFGIYWSVEAKADNAGFEAENGIESWDDKAKEQLDELIPKYWELVS